MGSDDILGFLLLLEVMGGYVCSYLTVVFVLEPSGLKFPMVLQFIICILLEKKFGRLQPNLMEILGHDSLHN